MTDRIGTIHRAVMVALGAILAGTCLPLATASAADEEQQEELQEVVITGSLLRRTDTETPSPVTVVSSEALEERGINTIAEAVQRLSANNAGTITAGWNTGWNFSSGANAPALRGLTVQATLSIADGLRLAPYPIADDGQRNFVDINTIPDAIVERIEVLRDGASSTYGADAIAGVINVITKKEIQGVHIGGSAGYAQHGGGAERRIDATWGFGDLASQGFNFYVSAEYQTQDKIKASDRGYPFNTGDLSRICGDTSCMHNTNWNGVSAEDGLFNGLISIPGVSLVRPVAAGDSAGNGRYQFLNAAAGCRNWQSVTLGADQLAQSSTTPTTVCEVNFPSAYYSLQPENNRRGLAFRFTGNAGENAQVYAMANIYQRENFGSITPLGFNGRPTAPFGSAQTYNVIAPVYVCATGVGTLDGLNTGCDATNGQLNPYNPFAAQGLRAQIYLRSPYGRSDTAYSRALRGVVGVDGSFGNDWQYSANFTTSEVELERILANFPVPQRIMNVLARGTFNFSDPYANSREMWEYIAPTSNTVSQSKLWQAQGTVSKQLMDLSGGPLQVALGASYRQESIDAPSANPANDDAPYTRYYGVNAVGTKGSRNVQSAFFELDAPVHTMLDLIASGRYDKYSTKQTNFSPKVGFKFTPVPALALRGTYSEGFRIPSFNEAFGLPTTGFLTRTISCTTYAAFCAAHGNNAYATQSYSLGVTQTGNPNLDPEKSKSFTVGVIAEPTDSVSLTIDFWRIKVDGLITGVTDTSAAEAQYYTNNGVVNIPGTTVVTDIPDQAFPNALPRLGFIQTSYTNQDSQTVSGLDFGATFTGSYGSYKLRSSFDASYLAKYELTTDAGVVSRYDGTLSPCNITSCSGSPKWRGSWQNSVERGNTTVTLTAYYTGGYDTASIDYGGVKGDCQANADNAASTAAYADGTPVNCYAKATWNADLTVRHKLNDNFTIYGEFLNVFDIDAPFDPSGGYALYQYNPAWAGANIIGRYFRVGGKFEF